MFMFPKSSTTRPSRIATTATIPSISEPGSRPSTPTTSCVTPVLEARRLTSYALGGIYVYVPETINAPTFPNSTYGYDPFYIEAGQHTLNGHDAMRYARTRATAGSDFSRAKRQQAVLLAIRDKALQI